jgi:hypothetical protein
MPQKDFGVKQRLVRSLLIELILVGRELAPSRQRGRQDRLQLLDADLSVVFSVGLVG